MNASDWAVLIGGLAAILWVNWYFFLAERSARERAMAARERAAATAEEDGNEREGMA